MSASVENELTTPDNSEVWTAYLLGAVILLYYGADVCPYLDQLDYSEFSLRLLGSFALAWLVRVWLVGWLTRLEEDTLRAGGRFSAGAYFALDFALWLLVGAVIGVWNFYTYGFPFVASAGKLMAGCATLGLFAAMFHTLGRQRRAMRFLASQGNTDALAGTRFLSIAVRVLIVFFAISLLVSAVIVLLIKRDFAVYLKAMRSHTPLTFDQILYHVVFVDAVMLLSGLLVAGRLAENMRILFDYQLDALKSVERGELDTVVPVVSNDEFSLIATQTNRMISGLKEKERIKSTFGKYVSPELAESILATGDGATLGGRETEVAVLFTDLRNYTGLSERLDAPELVEVLNEYFTGIVAAVLENDGVLDKFIGDAAMAVFGLGDSSRACRQAVAAAEQMRAFLEGFNESLAARGLPLVDNGVGVHFGSVVAGNIGSPERLEYTVIGDTVNVASRLESQTKALGTYLAVSDVVYERLDEDQRSRLVDLGAHALKGKSHDVQIFGAPPASSRREDSP